MRDRFADLQRSIDHFDEVELEATRPQSSAERVDTRLSKAREALSSLAGDVAALRRQQQQILAQPDVGVREKQQLENQMASVRRKTDDLRKAVREIDDEFVEFRKSCPSNAQVRIRQNQLDDLRRRLRDTIAAFHDASADYRSRVSVRVRRQLQAVGQDVSEAEVDQMLSGRSTEQVFYGERSVLSVSGKAVLEDCKQRHNEILELENNIAMMQEIFSDIEHMVEMQGDVVNNIEANVNSAEIHVNEGARKTKQAEIYKKAATKKKIFVISLCILILLILIAVAIILAVVLSGKKEK